MRKAYLPPPLPTSRMPDEEGLPFSDAPAGGHSSEPTADEVLTFRNCRLFPRSRLLLRDVSPVNLGSRAFDLLLVLLRSMGEVVTKDAIVKEVWPHTIVEESNLRFQMASLRNALGEDRDLIKTIPGRGYMFAAELPQTSHPPALLIFLSSSTQARSRTSSIKLEAGPPLNAPSPPDG